MPWLRKDRKTPFEPVMVNVEPDCLAEDALEAAEQHVKEHPDEYEWVPY